MLLDIKNMRKSMGLTEKDMAEAGGIRPSTYTKYESKGEIPSKYAYRMWLSLKEKGFALPMDFFYFTSYNLHLNMILNKYTQNDIVKLFKFSKQSTVSKLIQENIPMYEFKEDFYRVFNPLYVAKEISSTTLEESDITSLQAKGSIMFIKKGIEERRDKC